jgi:F-type H+-transporting ATPase subunit a
MTDLILAAAKDQAEIFNEVLEHLTPHVYSWAPTWKIGVIDLSLSNAVLNIFLAGGLVLLLFWTAASKPSIVPRRIQNLAELAMDYVKTEIVYRVMSPADGQVWGPFIAAIFFFILFMNVIGLIPIIGFTPTSNIYLTAALAFMVYFLAVAIGVSRHGFFTYWKKTLVHTGVPTFLAIAMAILIEPISQLARPFSLAVRLFANMLADHLLLLVFAGFIFIAGGFILVLVLPIAVAGLIVFTGFAILIAGIQALVFAFLSALYINDALHPGH